VGWESSVIHDPFSLQSLKEIRGIFGDILRICGIVLCRQASYDLLKCSLTVAEFQDIAATALDADHAFGEEHNLLFPILAPSATGGKTRLAAWRRGGHR
jgi:hypothetical protein